KRTVAATHPGRKDRLFRIDPFELQTWMEGVLTPDCVGCVGLFLNRPRKAVICLPELCGGMGLHRSRLSSAVNVMGLVWPVLYSSAASCAKVRKLLRVSLNCRFQRSSSARNSSTDSSKRSSVGNGT